MTALRARVTAGNPPTAVQMLGFDITDWAKQGVLAVGFADGIVKLEVKDRVIDLPYDAIRKANLVVEF